METVQEKHWQELRETLQLRYEQVNHDEGATLEQYLAWEQQVVINLCQDIRLCSAAGLHWWQRNQIDEVAAHYE